MATDIDVSPRTPQTDGSATTAAPAASSESLLSEEHAAQLGRLARRVASAQESASAIEVCSPVTGEIVGRVALSAGLRMMRRTPGIR